MIDKPPLRIATISANPDPDWAWLRDLMGKEFRVDGRRLEWRSYSMSPPSPKLAAWGRYLGASQFARDARSAPFDVIVSHGPWTTAWTEWVAGSSTAGARHLAFSFNFTDIPTGLRKTLMRRAFSKVDAFAVFTDVEQSLYAKTFDIDPNKILRAPWGVAPPISAPPPQQIEGGYFVSLGGEARDYATLCEAASVCPDVQFVAIARPHNFEGLSPPKNLKILFNLPFEEAWGLVWRAKAALIPLRSRETPCGLVTLVGGMHLGKAQIVTAAAGVSDYIVNDKTGLLIPPKDPGALAAAIRRVDADPALAASLGDAAKAYADAYCTEAATVAFFSDLLNDRFRDQ